MKDILILNGPNLNLLGKREPDIYGRETFEDYLVTLKTRFEHKAFLHYIQSNHEGVLLDTLHAQGFTIGGIVFNAGGYTHTSVALGDAIAAIAAPVVEVHISNVYARENFRHHSYLSKHCAGVIAGFGFIGYALAIEYLISLGQQQASY